MAMRASVICVVLVLAVTTLPCAKTSTLRAACTDLTPTQVDTSARLEALRAFMQTNGWDAFIVTSSNEHQGEYTPEHDSRREYITGFTGSAGDAVITTDTAVLWTDSRYYLQAEDQLDCNWQLVKTGEADAPTIEQWLVANLARGKVVAADDKILTFLEWKTFNTALVVAGLELKASGTNPVDVIWTENRPPYPTEALTVLSTLYAGVTWQDKIASVRSSMSDLGCQTFVVAALDEVAWFLNLRGTDIPYSPFFRAYLIVEATSASVYLPTEKQTNVVRLHLNSAGTGIGAIAVKNYDDFWTELAVVAARTTKVLLPDRYSYAAGISQKVYMTFGEEKVVVGVSPILTMRDFKNEVEAQGMINAHVRDAVALCRFLAILETGVAAGEDWDELKASERLNALRAEMDLSQGPSFETIAAFGANSALPHYSPTVTTNVPIDGSSMFMLDSGGQYLDGTTDVTRSLHFGTPTEMQRDVFTRLLIGCIRLASTRFPVGRTRADLEIVVRSPLFGLGLDFGHGTTHGIGAFGGVHEAFDSKYHKNFFGSQEPGYYLAGEYGMRLENIVTVVEANLPLSGDTTFLEFNTVTLVPYDRKLIVPEMLSADDAAWLNNYYDRIWQTVGNELLEMGDTTTRDWLWEQTRPIGSGFITKFWKFVKWFELAT